MSSQPTLDEFADASRPRNAGTEAPAWAGMDTDTQNQCLECKNHISADFARVMGDANGDVHACPACATSTELARGAAADSEVDR